VGFALFLILASVPSVLAGEEASARVVSAEGRTRIELSLPAGVTSKALGGVRLSDWVLASRAADLRAPVLGSLSSDGAPCAWGNATAQRAGRSVLLVAEALCPEGARLRWKVGFLESHGVSPRLRLSVRAGEGGRRLYASPERPFIDLKPAGRGLGERISAALFRLLLPFR
jgi:hypothetical protein